MPRVIGQFPRAHLLIAGEPLMSLRPLERQIDELGLRSHVSMHPAFVPEMTYHYLRAADLLIAPTSTSERAVSLSSPRTWRPSRRNRVGGLEFVEHERCGLIVPACPARLAGCHLPVSE
jgi:glycosyltransferase involved in cell wall biosynthesis